MIRSLLFFVLAVLSFYSYSQGGVACAEMAPICTDVGLNFTANAGIDQAGTTDPGNDYDCLFSQPNPTWYYFQIATDGDIIMELSADQDIDYAIWGPFSTLSVAQAACNSMGDQSPPNPDNGNIVDCSFSPTAIETPTITGAITGEVYVMLITNYAGVVQDISLSQTSGTGSTDCNIVTNPPCSISALNANPSGCDFTTNTYSVSGTIEFTSPPSSGSLVVEDCNGNITTVDNFPFASSPQNFSITGLASDGLPCDVEVYFTADPACTQQYNYTAPVCVNNCPTYELFASSPTEACGNQQYFLEVQNSACDGTVNFEVSGDYGSFPTEISWYVTSNLTGNQVASGSGGASGGTFNVAVGPIDPNVEGTIFNLVVEDSWGDGFSGGGFIQTESTDGTILGGPIAGNFGVFANSYFNSGIIVSSSTITVTTPTGTVTSVIGNCADHSVPVTLQNNNYCTPIVVDLPWMIMCDITGTLIASGTHSVTVYPQVPTSASDLVSIDWNASTCSWDVTPQNDCDALDLNVLYSISPDPSTLGSACANGTEEFTVTYLGFTNGPDCCSTGGPLTPATYTNNQGTTDFITQTAYGGTNNAAYGSVPGSGIGGNSTDVTIDISGSGYCFPDVPAPPGPPVAGEDDYYVDIYVDGVQIAIYGPLSDPPGSFNYSFTHADLLAAGVTYNQNSVVEVYVLPNQFFDPGPPQINTVYIPGANCNTLAAGEWSASNFSIDVQATYEQLVPSPANCTFTVNEPFTCCATAPLTATAPANQNVECIGDVPAVDINSVTNIVSDCPATVTFVSDASDGNTCPEVITRTYSVTDDCGNSINVTQTITVNDITPPTASNPGGIDVECVGDVPAADISVVTDAADNCTALPVVAFVSDASDGNTCPEVITRTYSVTDDCGNSINVTQTITVNDITPPTASNPPNINIPLAPAPAPDITEVTDAADNCTVAPIVAFVSDQSDGGDCPEVITRTYSVNDDCGNETLVTQSIIIGGGLVPIPTVTSNGPICEGEDVVFTINGLADAVVTYDIGVGPQTITLVGGTAFATVPAATTDITITLSNIADGTCSSFINETATVVVTTPETPTFNQLGPYCQGDSPGAFQGASLEGIVGTWSPNVIDPLLIGATTYTFTPDPGQCASATTMDIEITAPIVPTFTQIDDLCEGAEVFPGGSPFPVASTEGIIGVWAPVFDAFNTTTYTFTPDPAFCATTTTMTINIVGFPVVDAGGDQIITCINNVDGAQIGSPEVTGNTYSWSPTTGLSNPNIANPIANPSTATTYTLTVTNSTGCSSDGTVNVTIDDTPPIVSITNNTGSSTLTCTQLDISVTATGADSYTWDNGLGNNAAATITSPGIYTVTGTSLNGCSSTQSIEIFQDNNVDLFVVLSDPEICSGEEVLITANSANATGFDWIVLQNGVSGASAGTISNTPSGAEIMQALQLTGVNNGSVEYTITPTLGGCIGASQTVIVDVIAPFIPQFDLLGPFCIDDTPTSLPLVSNSGITGTWNPTTISTATAGTSTYIFTPNPNQCAISQDIDVTVNDLPVVSFSADNLGGCAPLLVNLTSANGSGTWTISNGVVLEGAQVQLNLLNPGCYDVTLEIQQGGCSNTLTEPDFLCVELNPIADFTATPDIFTDQDVLVSFTNLSSGASSFIWDFGDENTSTFINPSNLYDYTEEGALITLTAISEFGCTDQAQLIIEYDEQEVFYIPNTFTPDGDNFNQMFTPVFYSGFDPFNFEMLIFNRWGEVVFETRNSEIGWDGTYGLNGMKASDGAYTWKITYKNPKTDQRKVIAGHVTLIR